MIVDGKSIRFTAEDFPAGSAQRAIADAHARVIGATVAPVASPTVQQILDGDTPAIRKYCERVENAWRDPPPVWPGGPK